MSKRQLKALLNWSISFGSYSCRLILTFFFHPPQSMPKLPYCRRNFCSESFISKFDRLWYRNIFVFYINKLSYLRVFFCWFTKCTNHFNFYVCGQVEKRELLFTVAIPKGWLFKASWYIRPNPEGRKQWTPGQKNNWLTSKLMRIAFFIRDWYYLRYYITPRVPANIQIDRYMKSAKGR